MEVFDKAPVTTGQSHGGSYDEKAPWLCVLLNAPKLFRIGCRAVLAYNKPQVFNACLEKMSQSHICKLLLRHRSTVRHG